MLSQSTRPKSQPPPLKFSNGPMRQSANDWDQLMVGRYKVDSAEVSAASVAAGANVVAAVKQLDLSSSPSSSSASSPTSSSSSSLASSSLSLSTNSSTSTVLAALNTIQVNRSKSMIARYSAPPEQQQHANKMGSGVVKRQPACSAPPTNNESNHGDEHHHQEQDEDEDQMPSSSSSTSSSSGLSSMNLSSNTSSHEGYSLVSNSSSSSSYPVQMFAPAPRGAYSCYQDKAFNEGSLESEVGKCLNELIDSVAANLAAESKPPKRVGSDTSLPDAEADNEIEYKTFQLHEAVLAQTRSATTSSGGSSDEDATSPTLASGPALVESPGTPSGIRPGVLPERQAILIGDDLSQAEARGRVQLIGWISDLGEIPNKSLALEFAHEYIAAALHENFGSKQQQQVDWLVAVKPNEQRIEWRRQLANGARAASGGENLNFAQVLDCFVEGRIVVWILDRSLSLTTNDRSRTATINVSRHKQANDKTLELETTLDDIAQALDEPIGSSCYDNKSASNTRQPQPSAHQAAPSIGCHDIEALVWLCSNELEAKWLGDVYRSSQERFEMSYSQATRTTPELQVEPTTTTTRTPGGRFKVEKTLDRDAVAAADDDDDRVTLCSSSGITNDPSAGPTGSHQVSGHQKQVKSFEKATAACGVTKRSPNRLDDQLRVLPACGKVLVSVENYQEKTNRANMKEREEEAPVSSRQASMVAEKEKSGEFVNNNQEKSVKESTCKSSKRLTDTKQTTKATALNPNEKRHKKSASGLNLSQTVGTSTPATSSNSSSSSGLASYYRSVASKVISNGQSRIKSLKDEMIKLNNRMPTSSSSAAAKRISMSAQSADRSQHLSALPVSSSGSSRNLSLLDLPSATGPSKSSPVIVSNDALNSGHQHRTMASNRAMANVKSNLPQASSSPIAAASGENETAQVPVVKPRTSILKNKNHQSHRECDINNNNNNNINRAPADHPVQSRARACSDKANQVRDDGNVYTVAHASATMTTKPKSILKASKSVSNILADENSRSSTPIDYPRQQQCYHQQQCYAGQRHHNESGGARNAANDGRSAGSLVDIGPNYYSNRQQVGGSRAPSSGELESRRKSSAYSVINVGPSQINHRNNELEDPERASRENAFERLRQRASYYDISRLMSKSGLQGQLLELRSGSSNSIAGKSRQRRPALLLDDSQARDYSALNEQSNNHESEEASSHGGKHKENHLSPDKRSTTNIVVKTTSSGADGTVRAKVSAAQLKSSGSDWQSTTNQQNYSTLRPQSTKINTKAAILSQDDLSDASHIKKSEFDPRSLRRMPSSGAKSSSGNIGKACNTESPMEPTKSSHRSSSTAASGKLEHGYDSSVRDSDKGKSLEVVNVPKRLQPVVATKDTPSTTCSSSNEESSAEEESQQVNNKQAVVVSSSLSKSGPFNLLRQSFNQKTLSSMLKFSTRASLRVKAPPQQVATTESGESGVTTTNNGSGGDKASAIAIAEANLIAAKQLKQRAQKLKEQQKREQQQQHQVSIDSKAMMLAAVQYNQHLQRQQQQQQQQLLYQQYHTAAARSQMFDASSVHLQHQMLFQRQQQQQMAYMANLNSAHYIAQQMAVMQPAAAPVVPMGAIPAQPLMYVQPAPMPIQAQQQSAGIFKKSILKGGGNKSAHASGPMIYPHQNTNNQQMIPMAVNHHSSFNIVYTGSTSATSQITQMHQQHQHQQTAMAQCDEPIQSQTTTTSTTKHSSLGASMRKTVKSILINRSSFLSSSTSNIDSTVEGNNKANNQVDCKLKSALKSSKSRELVLNSEGSDGDGSSSDSTTVNSTSESSSHTNTFPKSVLKKTTNQQKDSLLPSSASSDSSCSSSGAFRQSISVAGSDKNSNLTRGFDYRQSIKVNEDSKGHCSNSSSIRATKRNPTNGANARKNVTFSTKLTSIL